MWGKVLPKRTSRCTLLHLPVEEDKHHQQLLHDPILEQEVSTASDSKGWRATLRFQAEQTSPMLGSSYHSTEVQVNGGFTFFASSPSDCTYIHAKRLLTECCTIRLLITGSFPSLSTLLQNTTGMGRCCWDSREVWKTQLRRLTFTIHFSKGRHHYKTDKITGHTGVGLPSSGWWHRYVRHKTTSLKQKFQGHLWHAAAL